MENKCDIIIPIYNAYECVKLCIESVLKNTDFSNNNLILINDKSTDERIIPLLKKYDKNYEFISYIENKTNLGFVGTVNSGMKESKNDVLLLNSDTEVTKNWLDKIKKCAYSQKKVATVAPLSNNATLLSVPIGLTKNELPSNMSLDEYADMIEKISYKDYNELPTSHGFCMFIKREVLNLVGYFDEDTFKKGYGEENDFSFRCLDYGYKNLVCDDTIILHKESMSFTTEKEELIKRNLKILKDRYPIYSRRIELWCENFPLKKTCENIDYQIQLHNRKNILFLLHDFSNARENVGGTTLHVLDLIDNLRDKYNFHVLALENAVYKLYSFFENTEKTMNFYNIDNNNIIPRYSKKYKKMLENIVEGFRIDTIHVHHMIGHYFDVADVIKEKHLNGIITLHDFYCLCPTINMLYNMESYCPLIKNPDCKNCIKHKTNLSNNIIDNWRDDWKEFLANFNSIITPSENTKKQVLDYLPNLKINTIEHGINYEKNNYKIDLEKDTFNVAFVGVMSIHKGGNVLKYLIKNSKSKKIKFHLFGISEFSELKKNTNNYVYHGKYKREELPRLIKENNIDLICSFSIWAETYSYTLTEDIASGVPVLAYDIGAVGERVKKYKFGWLLPVDSKNEIVLEKITEISKNKDNYLNVLKKLKSYKIKDAKEMSREYIPLYDKLKKIELEDKNARILKQILCESYEVHETVSSAETEWILNSLKWKIVSKIKVPESLKKIIKKIIK